MKNFLCILLAILLGSIGYAQLSEVFPIDEFAFSINGTNVSIPDDASPIGWGLGLYIYHAKKNPNRGWTLGMEYNQSHFYRDHTYEGRFASGRDWEYRIHHLSIPILLRFRGGQKLFWMFNPGVFADVNLFANRKGQMSSRSQLEDGTWQVTTSEVKSRVSLQNAFNFGLIVEAGLGFPVGKYLLWLKPGYKWGLRDLSSYGDEIKNVYFRLAVGFTKPFQ